MTPDSTSRPVRKRVRRFPWRAWLVRGGMVATIALAAIALLVPNGKLIAGSILMGVGGLMVLGGYCVGLYVAFQEDSLYGCLYLIIPMYTAYYIVTRWDELWICFACSTVGFGIVLLGTQMIRWGGWAV